MLAVIAELQRDIARFLKIGRFTESERDGSLRFYSSDSIPHVVAATGGFSGDTMDQSVDSLLSRFRPKAIVSAGFASSADPDLTSGEIVICDRILTLDGPAYSWRKSDTLEIQTDPSFIERLHYQRTVSNIGFEVGACVTLPQTVVNPRMKEWLGRTFDAAAADLDGYWIANVVQKFRTPCIPVRAIVDTMEQDVSLRAVETLRQPPATRMLHSLGYVAANPARLVEVATLSARAAKARMSLARFLYRISRTRLAVGED